MASKTTDFREEITEKIITAIENGTAPWQQPWNGAEAPQNGITKHQYNGINTVILSLAMMGMDGDKRNDPRWLTYRQAQSNDWYVRKGEKGTRVILWKPTIGTDEHGNREITAVLQRTFTVFHASQIEEAHEKAEKIIANSGAKIVFGGGEAFYSPSKDYIQMPPKTDFRTAEGYYSTFLHELVHFTGHPSRLDRAQRCGRFSKDYAFEELIAEMGSLFIASSAGIPQSETEFQNHASYIDGWLSNLRSDNMYIFKAAAEASKAAGYLLKRAGIGTDDESQGDQAEDDQQK